VSFVSADYKIGGTEPPAKITNWLQEEQDEHGQGKWEGKQKHQQQSRKM
jgi:hypothetical protein